ncbi:MAG: hypothetical protein HOL92_04500, partial [Opitutales bacterium]|nr:hypothetical protein [Opitutales bacterium]
AKRVEAKLGKRVELRGPVPCSIEKMKDNYRFQVWYFTSNIGVLMAELVGIAGTINWPSDVIQVLDADPISLS